MPNNMDMKKNDSSTQNNRAQGNQPEVQKSQGRESGSSGGDHVAEGRELLQHTIQDLKGLRTFFKENWQAVIGSMMTSAVTAFLAHSAKPKDDKMHS